MEEVGRGDRQDNGKVAGNGKLVSAVLRSSYPTLRNWSTAEVIASTRAFISTRRFYRPVWRRESPFSASNRAIVYLKMGGLGCHDHGVLDKVVFLTYRTAIPKTVRPSHPILNKAIALEQGSSIIQFGCRGHTGFGLAVRRESPASRQHEFFEDAMIVALLFRSLK